jgi:hypothetical protein
MERIKQAWLERQVEEINKITGSPEAPYTRKNGKTVANVGNYFLDWAYGGVRLARMCNEGGGMECVLNQGFSTKRELYNELRAYIAGIKYSHTEEG